MLPIVCSSIPIPLRISRHLNSVAWPDRWIGPTRPHTHNNQPSGEKKTCTNSNYQSKPGVDGTLWNIHVEEYSVITSKSNNIDYSDAHTSVDVCASVWWHYSQHMCAHLLWKCVCASVWCALHVCAIKHLWVGSAFLCVRRTTSAIHIALRSDGAFSVRRTAAYGIRFDI